MTPYIVANGGGQSNFRKLNRKGVIFKANYPLVL
jgi:hypothetical protein